MSVSLPPPGRSPVTPLNEDLLDAGAFRRLLRRSTLKLLVALLIPLFALASLAVFLRRSAHWVDHSDRVIAEANHVEKLLITMQSSFRGFRLMKDENILATYTQAKVDIVTRFDLLRGLVADNAEQTAVVLRVRADAERWMKYSEHALAQLQAGATEAQLLPDMLAARAIITSAGNHVRALLNEEERLRAGRTATLDLVYTSLLGAFAVAVLIGIPLLTLWLRRVLREISGLYQASRAAVERRATELQVTLSSIGDAVIATDAQGRVDFLNPVAEMMLGWSNHEAHGRELGEVFVIFNEETGATAENPVGRVLKENITVGLANHTVLRSRAGREYPIEDSAAPIRDDQGRVLGVILVFHDVSAKRTDELRLAENERRLRLLSEVIALQVWTATPAGELDYANKECADYFGGDVERDVLGNAWAQFVHPDDLASAVKAWQAALASGESYEIEFRLKRRDGAFRWFLVRARAMSDATGRIVKWFGSNTDINDLKLARDAAVRASRAKDEFLAALSHELRTPLTPVLLTAASLREDQRLPAEVREQLGMMERNIALEARLIDDLLDLTAISRGKFQLRAQPCDAHSLIGLALEIVRDDARAKGVAIERAFGARQHGIHADPARFQQVIWNLLRNAVKFTPRGGKVSVSTREETTAAGETWLRIEVTDTGIGIEPALLQKIFLPFEQGALTGAHRFGGLGLGLAIARAVVDLHGGRISAQSAGPDRGATFVVEFPGAIEPPMGATPGSQPASSAPARRVAPLRLLLVEDHENTLQTLRRLLELDGHQVVTAGTVAGALVAAMTGKFDLVISDLGLPDGTGTELMEKLRDTYGLRGIALSGYGMEEDLARSRAAGFITHLVKPVHIADLHRVLATLPPA